MRVIGIDVGIRHLGVADLLLRRGQQVVVETLELANLMTYTHRHLDEDQCSLPHTKELSDRLLHWVADRRPILDRCDLLAIERQPICGIQSVEQLLFATFRSKAVLIHPRRLHARHNCSSKTHCYGQRKEVMEAFAKQLCGEEAWGAVEQVSRRHDVADAVAIAHLAWEDATKDEREREAAEIQRQSLLGPSRWGELEYNGK